MSGVSKARRHERAAGAAFGLALRYRHLADDLYAAARHIENTPLEHLARTPVKHMHSSARRQEEALDEALMAL